MQELGERLAPVMATSRAASVVAWRQVGVVALAGVFVVGALLFRQHLDVQRGASPAGEVQVSATRAGEPPTPRGVDPPTAASTPPRAEPHDIAAPVISVDSLPPASAPPPRPHASVAEPACTGELELVERADATLRTGDAQRAFDLTREHAERCPRGAFVQERERIAIEALAQLGRTSEVRARARSFERRFPLSPHLWRIRSLAEPERAPE
ncbi:MAG: hypothetical protein K0S65_6547 [Labilithrix sp.]|nr:hypothetical protein [Labilithrix sp.]